MSTETERLAHIQRDPLFPCIQYGKCTGGYPISVISPHFNIRRLLYDTFNSKGKVNLSNTVNFNKRKEVQT
jgi:heterodisulfide reductase subunit C